ncbi:hypothetical protein Scep_016221 [Stephania cephalantha]|uniref:Uncharacterized protein n=1 Tax=Stephania cephalantha TaxID=152367 RepID=A0AAP0INE0_9MAGN
MWDPLVGIRMSESRVETPRAQTAVRERREARAAGAGENGGDRCAQGGHGRVAAAAAPWREQRRAARRATRREGAHCGAPVGTTTSIAAQKPADQWRGRRIRRQRWRDRQEDAAEERGRDAVEEKQDVSTSGATTATTPNDGSSGGGGELQRRAAREVRKRRRQRRKRGAGNGVEQRRVIGPIDPRRDNNRGQGVVTSTKVDDAMDSNGFWIGDLQ